MDITKVAEKIMGWELSDDGQEWLFEGRHSMYATIVAAVMNDADHWDPINNLNHAFMVEQEMFDKGYCLNLIRHNRFSMSARFGHTNEGYEIESSLPGEAICLAALEAVKS